MKLICMKRDIWIYCWKKTWGVTWRCIQTYSSQWFFLSFKTPLMLQLGSKDFHPFSPFCLFYQPRSITIDQAWPGYVFTEKKTKILRFFLNWENGGFSLRFLMSFFAISLTILLLSRDWLGGTFKKLKVTKISLLFIIHFLGEFLKDNSCF